MSTIRLIALLTFFAPFAYGIGAPPAPLPPLNVIYSFPLGESPRSGLLQGTNGNFYGAASTGASNNFGMIFEVTSQGILADLIYFNGVDGAAPLASLIQDRLGNFYGTTSGGGPRTNGTIFEIPSSGLVTSLISFNGTNGATPAGPLVHGTNGDLYGATFGGGLNGLGTIFVANNQGFFRTLYTFSGTDGANPSAGLITGRDGNLYGTTQYGGANGLGTIFKITYGGTLTTLASFSGTNGAFPGGLVEDSVSNFYGTTIDGGAASLGTIFQLSFRGIRTLLNFTGENGSNPNSPLCLASDGLLYGTTLQGGAYGLGTIFRMNPASLHADIFSFQGTNGAYPQSGIIEGADQNFYGGTSAGGGNNSGEVYQFLGFPPIIVTQPRAQQWKTNGTATFQASASGSEPLTYQWELNGVPIAGSTNSLLTVHPEQTNDIGAYSVVISNSFGSITSSNAALSIAGPTLTQRPIPVSTTNGVLTVAGAARDIFGIANVQYQFNGVSWQLASTTNQWTNWFVTLSLQPGTNTFQSEVFDPFGNSNVLKKVTFFYETFSPVTFITNGSGIISRTFAARNLIVGKTYVVKAVPRPNNLFSAWSGSIFATNNPLVFLMQSNMTVQANFITNPFVAVAGIYNGLFYTNPVTEETSGMLRSLTVASTGAYSGLLVSKGVAYRLAGRFDLSGQTSSTALRSTAQGGPLLVNMNLDWNALPAQLSGTVSGADGGTWTVPLIADRASTALGTGRYNLASPPATVISRAGTVAISGTLTDGTKFSEVAGASAQGEVPLYASLYHNTGLLIGWLEFGSGAKLQPIWWIKPALTNGFTNILVQTFQ